MVFPIFCCRMKIPISGEFLAPAEVASDADSDVANVATVADCDPEGTLFAAREVGDREPVTEEERWVLSLPLVGDVKVESTISHLALGTWHLAVGVFFGEGRTLAKMGR